MGGSTDYTTIENVYGDYLCVSMPPHSPVNDGFMEDPSNEVC